MNLDIYWPIVCSLDEDEEPCYKSLRIEGDAFDTILLDSLISKQEDPTGPTLPEEGDNTPL